MFSEEIGTGCPYTITRKWVATDNCGNQDSLVQVLTVEDNEAPTFIGSAPSGPVDCDNIPVAANITVTDNCDGNASLVFSEEIGTGCPYTITRKWVATDNCGNQDSLVQVLTVEDNEAPTFVGSAPSGPVDCDNIPVVANITTVSYTHLRAHETLR